jgi:hypothetical protein
MEIIGRDIKLGIAVGETTEAEKWIKKTSANVRQRVEHAEDDTTRCSIVGSEGRRVTQKYIEGDIDGITHVDVLGYWLANIYGDVSTTDNADGTYTHEFTLDESAFHTPLTLFILEGDTKYQMNDIHVGSHEITASTDDYVRFSCSVVGKDADSSTETTDYDEESDFIGRDVTIKIADTKAGLDSASALTVKSTTISTDMSLERDHAFGSYDPELIYGPRKEVEITLEKNYIDDTFKDLYEGDDSKFMRITIEGESDISNDESGVPAKIEYEFYKVMVTDWDKSDDADALVTEDVTLKAFYNHDEETDNKVTLVNNTADYTEES